MDGELVLLNKTFVHINELGVNIHEGIHCEYNEDAQECFPDFSVYIFFRHDTNEFLYAEGGSSLEVAISNYTNSKICNGKKLEMDYIDKGLLCDIYIGNEYN